MSLGIQLQGHRAEIGAGEVEGPGGAGGRAGATWIREVASWAAARFAELLETDPSIWEYDGMHGVGLELHPCAEPVTIALSPAGGITASGNTSSAGPGYHQFVCTLLDEFAARFEVEWDRLREPDTPGDETGYFESRDRADLERAMLRWLAGVAMQLTQPEHEEEGIAVSMSVDHQFDAGNAIVTPMGPRSREWAEATSRMPESGAGFFAWWEEGDRAEMRLNRAIARMWASIRWTGARSELEARQISRTLEDLEAAFTADSGLDMPWREWIQLADLAGVELPERGIIEKRAAAARGPLIGYRRRPVRVVLPGGWNVRVPGSFSETYEEEGAFLAWDERRNIRVSSFSMAHDHACGDEACAHEHELPTPEQMLEDDPEVQLPPALEELERWEEDGLMGAGKIFREEEEGDAYWVLLGKVAGEGRLALCTVCYDDEADREWAIETWRSLR